MYFEELNWLRIGSQKKLVKWSGGELTQIKRHRGRGTEGRQKGSLTHGKKTPAIGVNEHE
jgi:hypothetical protein